MKDQPESSVDHQIENYQNQTVAAKASAPAKALGYGAVAAGSLFAMDQADAAVIAGPAGVVPVGAAPIDLDGDGVTDFGVQHGTSGGGSFLLFPAASALGPAAIGVTAPGGYPLMVRNASGGTTTTVGGDQVIPAVTAVAAAATTGEGWMGWGSSTDAWGAFAASPEPVTGFAPVSFVAGNGIGSTTGWIQFELTVIDPGAGTTALTVLASAYTDPIPEPSAAALAGLAAGATFLRRRRKQAA